MKKHLAVMVALSMLIGVTAPSYSPSQGFEALQAEASGFTYTQDQQEALTYINSIRKEMGLSQLTLDPFLSEAAQNHANYLKTNGTAFGHDEVKGHSGFTGSTPSDRLKAVGYNPSGVTGEAISPSAITLKIGVDSLLYAPYHRTILLKQDLDTIGVGYSGSSLVITTESDGKITSSSGTKEAMYPYDGQINVGTKFLGDEEPNPLKQFGIRYSGYVISYTPEVKVDEQGKIRISNFKNIKFTLKDNQGNIVPVFEETNTFGATLYFFPKDYLKTNTKYTANISYTNLSTGKDVNKTWSFTTGDGSLHTDQDSNNTPPPSNNNNGGNKGSGNVIGPPTEEDVYGPSKPTTPTAPTVTGKDYADFKPDQYWANDMLWAIENKLIQGYKNVKNTKTGKYENLLKPNAPLTEYQFLVMFFRYSMPSYVASKGATMDVVYQLAKDYNLPTKGKVGAFTGANDTITRGRVAQILATFYNHKVVSQRDAVTFMYNAKISTGYDSNNKTYENFGVNDPLKRAHIVSFLRNYDKFKQTNP
ncbi:CAP domain-containing protein [Lysinibacillus telephonicus]|uniref:CAP domain-containing protein n=1 Tax=Lysinibacillus telephonicus TaxID=1714840 RepID=UPI0031FD3E72